MLTHADFSKEPIRINMGGFDYSQILQKTEYRDGKGAPLQITYRGTQTYDWDGRPSDSDND